MSLHRPYLVLARVGEQSLHPAWMSDERDFDLVVQCYGTDPARWEGSADLVLPDDDPDLRGGRALHRVLSEHPELLRNYEAIWFPDDDIACDAATISAAFALHTRLGLGLSQPALSPDSYFTHYATLAHPGLHVRFTNFVEALVPIFSAEALAACWHTMDQSRSGFGLDLVWQTIVPGLGLRSAILDAVQVRHTRPVGSGQLYADQEEPAVVEGRRIARAYGVPAELPFEVEEVVTADGTRHLGAEAARIALKHLPSPLLQAIPPWDRYETDLRIIASDQAELRPGVILLPCSDRPIPRAHGAPQPHDGAMVLLIGTDAAARERQWQRCGWRAQVASDEALPELLPELEQHHARVIDVAGDLGLVERCETAARSVGAGLVLRVDDAALLCPHDLRSDVSAMVGPGGCPGCRRLWRRLVGSAGAVVASSPTAAARLEVLTPGSAAVSALADDELRSIAQEPPPTPVAPSAVIVFAPSHDAARPVLAALARQQGLTEPCTVTVVNDAHQDDWSALGRAFAAVASQRVLVLGSGDTPGPWCVADHSRAVSGPSASSVVVLSPARSVGVPGDLSDLALTAGGPALALGDRASIPVDVLAAMIEPGRPDAHVVARLAAATAPWIRLPAPTHSVAPVRELDVVRRTAWHAGVATGLAEQGPTVAPSELVHFTATTRDRERVIGQAAQASPEELRWSIAELHTGERWSEVLERFLTDEVVGHDSAGARAAEAILLAAAQGRPWSVGVDADDPKLAQIRDAVAAEASGTVELVVVHRSEPLDALGWRNAAQVQLPVRAARWVGVDLTPYRPGPMWSPGLAVPIPDALHAADWVRALAQAYHRASAAVSPSDPRRAELSVATPTKET